MGNELAVCKSVVRATTEPLSSEDAIYSSFDPIDFQTQEELIESQP
jgi:hypothetical protein